MNSEKLSTVNGTPIVSSGSHEGVKALGEKPNDDPVKIINIENPVGNNGGVNDEVVTREKPKDGPIETMVNENPIGINGSYEGVKGGNNNEVVWGEKTKDDLVETMSSENQMGINGSYEGIKGDCNDEVASREKTKDYPIETLSNKNTIGMNGSYEGVKGGGNDAVVLGGKPNDDPIETMNSEKPIEINESYEDVKGGHSDKVVLEEKPKDDQTETINNENLIGFNGSYEGVKGAGGSDEVALGEKPKDDSTETMNNKDLTGINGSDEGEKGGSGNDEVVLGEEPKDDPIETMNNESPIGINGSYEGVKSCVKDESVEGMNSGNSGNCNGNSVGINMSYEGAKVDGIDEVAKTMDFGDSGDSDENLVGVYGFDKDAKGGGDDGVEGRQKPVDDQSGKLGNNNENPSDGGGEVALGDKPKDEPIESTNSGNVDDNKKILNGFSGSYEDVKCGDDVEVASGEKPKDDSIVRSPSSTGAIKGKGLRKWRRIKRDETCGKVVVGPADSGHSEDPYIVSSTMASGSVLRNTKKGVNEVDEGKAQVKNTKKARGEREKVGKENSVSSLESDSRSSNFVFVQGVDSMASNGRQREKVEAQDGEKSNGNYEVGAAADISKENGDLAAADDNQSSVPELDPLTESISKLQSVQEELEKEVQKLKELGDESQETTEEEVHEASSSGGTYTLRENSEFPLHYLNKHVNILKQDVDLSKTKLEEANAVFEAKETKVTKLEYEEIQAEIEDLFRHKLEAEFQYLAIARAIEKWKADMDDQVVVSDELETTINVMKDAQTDVNMLKRQAENLETRVKDAIIETEQVSKLQKRVRQVTWCLFIQLILLFLVVVSFDSRVSPHDAEVVPT